MSFILKYACSDTGSWCNFTSKLDVPLSGVDNTAVDSCKSNLSFCTGSASETRGAVSNVINLSQPDNDTMESPPNTPCCIQDSLNEPLPDKIDFTQCATSNPHM